MIVHADKTGQHGVTGEVQNFRTRWYRGGDRVSNRHDGAVADDQGLINTGSPFRTVDHADMGEHYDGIVELHILSHLW